PVCFVEPKLLACVCSDDVEAPVSCKECSCSIVQVCESRLKAQSVIQSKRRVYFPTNTRIQGQTRTDLPTIGNIQSVVPIDKRCQLPLAANIPGLDVLHVERLLFTIYQPSQNGQKAVNLRKLGGVNNAA